MDRLSIAGLELWTCIGVPVSERAREQRILVDIECTLDSRASAEADEVQRSIDYFDLTQAVRALAQTERRTIERFAQDIADLALSQFKPESVTVTVKKFPFADADHVSLTITRP